MVICSFNFRRLLLVVDDAAGSREILMKPQMFSLNWLWLRRRTYYLRWYALIFPIPQTMASFT